MGFLKSIFGSKPNSMKEKPDNYALASMIATTIDGIIEYKGYSELEKPDTAIVLTNDYRISMRWNSALEIGNNILSFAYLNEFQEFHNLKGALGLEAAKSLPPDQATEIIEMMTATLGQRAVDALAISILNELKRRVT